MDKLPTLSRDDFTNDEVHNQMNEFRGYLSRYVREEEQQDAEDDQQDDSNGERTSSDNQPSSESDSGEDHQGFWQRT
jgi:hypothetical protein